MGQNNPTGGPLWLTNGVKDGAEPLVRASPRGPHLEAVLVDAQAYDLRLKGLVGNSQDCSCTTRAGNPTLALCQCGFDCFSFAVGKFPLVIGEDTVARSLSPRELARLSLKPCLVH